MMANETETETETEELDSVEKERTIKVVPSLQKREVKSRDAPGRSPLFHRLSTVIHNRENQTLFFSSTSKFSCFFSSLPSPSVPFPEAMKSHVPSIRLVFSLIYSGSFHEHLPNYTKGTNA